MEHDFLDTDGWDQLSALFEHAVALPPGERAAFLDAACADAPALRRHLESLLQGDDEAQAEDEMGMLVFLTGIAFSLAVVAAGSQWGYSFLGRRVGYQMIVDLRVRVARHLMGLSMHYHGRRHFGDVLSRVSADVTRTAVR